MLSKADFFEEFPLFEFSIKIDKYPINQATIRQRITENKDNHKEAFKNFVDSIKVRSKQK